MVFKVHRTVSGAVAERVFNLGILVTVQDIRCENGRPELLPNLYNKDI